MADKLGKCPMKMLTEAEWMSRHFHASDCDAEDCEWWHEGEERCAILLIASRLESLLQAHITGVG